MNRVVRGSSLLIVTAIVAACAAQRDEGKADADRQGPPPQQPATEEVDASLAKAEARDQSVQEIVVTGAKAGRVRQDSAPLSVSSVSSAATMVANYCCPPPVYQQPTNTERYQHMDDNPVHLVKEQPVSTFSIDVDTGAYANVRR